MATTDHITMGQTHNTALQGAVNGRHHSLCEGPIAAILCSPTDHPVATLFTTLEQCPSKAHHNHPRATPANLPDGLKAAVSKQGQASGDGTD